MTTVLSIGAPAVLLGVLLGVLYVKRDKLGDRAADRPWSPRRKWLFETHPVVGSLIIGGIWGAGLGLLMAFTVHRSNPAGTFAVWFVGGLVLVGPSMVALTRYSRGTRAAD